MFIVDPFIRLLQTLTMNDGALTAPECRSVGQLGPPCRPLSLRHRADSGRVGVSAEDLIGRVIGVEAAGNDLGLDGSHPP